MPQRFSTSAILVIGALTLTSCAAGGLPNEAASDASLGDLKPYLTQDVSWGECSSEWLIEADYASPVVADSVVECASVLVPAVYGDSGVADDFGIALMRLSPLEGSTPERAIFINPGGPGGSGVEQVQS
jgi:hypothetical protein